MDNEGHASARTTVLPTAVGVVALLALFGYTLFLHQGLGQAPGGWASKWWHPTMFLLLTPTVGGWADVPFRGTVYLTLPAAALAVAVFLGTRSAVARALAASFVVMAALFCVAAFKATGAWEFFHWRFSAVMVWIGLATGFTIMSPALAEAWLRRGWVVRLLLYVPLFFAIVAVIRNATGTDESLVANFSPWPGITVFGLEMGSYTIVGILYGLAIGLGALSQWGKRPLVAVCGVVVGAVFPAVWFSDRFTNTSSGPLVGIVLLALLLLGLTAAIRSGDRSAKLAHRAAFFALGATLVIAPIFTGRAWAAADYTVNKFVRARIISDALAAYYAREGVYPDRLSQLVEEGDLAEIPRPRVGFDFLYDIGLLPPIAFSYRGLGSSYVLEFVSTEWVQCAYNPPWSSGDDEYADDEEEYDDEELDDESTEEAWSCPDTRPALWGNDERSDAGEDG